MRISTLLKLGYVAFVVMIGLVFAWVGPNRNFNSLTYLLLVLFVVLMLWLLTIAARGTATPFLLWLSTFLFIYICVPFVGYLILPGSFPFWRALNHGVVSVNLALVFITFGTAALAGGYVFGARVTRGPDEATTGGWGPPGYRLWFSPTAFFVIAMILVAIEVKISLRYAVFYVGTSAAEGAWWRRFVSADPLKLLGTAYLLFNWKRLTPLARTLIGAPVLLFAGTQVILGSRSSVIYFGLLVLQVYMVLHGDFKVGRRLALSMVAIVAAGVLMFPLGTAFRYLWGELFRSGGSLRDVIPESATIGMLFRTQNFTEVLTRVNLFDTISIIIDGPILDVKPYLGWAHDFKAFINMLVPGEPFPGVLDGSSVFPHVYMGIPVEYFRDYLKYTMPFTLWGLAYMRFGWAGGLGFMFAVGFMSVTLYQAIGRLVRGPLRPYAQLWMFVTCVLLLNTFGLDYSAIGVVYDVLPYGLVLLLLWPATRLIRTWPPPAPVRALAPSS